MEFVVAIVTVDPEKEFVNRGFRPATSSLVEAAKRRGVSFDTRSRLEVIEDLEKTGVEAFPPTLPSGLLGPNSRSRPTALDIAGQPVLPLGGIANKVTVLCNETGEHIIYKSDEHGFNNPPGAWHRPLEIAILGDSMVHGFCVPSGKHFVDLIRQRYPATLNLGMGSNGPLIELATLREYLTLSMPRLVLWCYYEGNDLEDLAGERHHHFLRQYLMKEFRQDLLNRQSELDQSLVKHVGAVRHGYSYLGRAKRFFGGLYQPVEIEKLLKLQHLRALISDIKAHKGAVQDTPEINYSARREVLDLFGVILAEAQQSVATWDGTLVFVYLPQWERYSHHGPMSSDREHVLELVRKLHLPIIDLVPAFAAQQDPLELFPFRQPVHYNVDGNRVVAAEILRALPK